MSKPETFTLVSASDMVFPGAPRGIAEYFGLWAMEERAFRSIVDGVQGMNLVAHVQANANHDGLGRDLGTELAELEEQGIRAQISDRRMFSTTGERDQVGIIRLRGTLMKRASSLSGGTSTVFARRQIRQATDDDNIESILMILDTPGGTVAGTQDLANEVAAAAKKKRVTAYVEDLTASAGMWIASQATEIVANNQTALIGSIGTYTVLVDYSRQAENLGVKVHVIGAGEFKGMGEPGTPVSEAHIAELGRIINALNDEFISAISAGRNMSAEKVRSIADGRVHPAAAALEMGLIDRIEPIDSVIGGLTSQPSRRNAMSTKDTQAPEQQATIEQIELSVPGADADFVLGCYKANMTIPQVVQAWSAKITAENEQLRAQLAQAQQQPASPPAATAPATTPAITGNQVINTPAAGTTIGVAPVVVTETAQPQYDGDTGDARSDYDSAIRATNAQATVKDPFARLKAQNRIKRRRSPMFAAFLLDTNRGIKARRQIVEKMDLETNID